MTKILLSSTQITTLHKIRAHTNIGGNEHANTLAKHDRELDHKNATTPLELAHPTPYYFQKDWWHSMQETPYKGPISHLKKHIVKHDKGHN